MNHDQLTARHLGLVAYIYIRQSSAYQVLHNQESQRRQRDLVKRALDLGWPRDLVMEIDEDMGQSASRSQTRSGFERLVTETALGKVGIIIALEISRVSRSNRDWYHLLDVCAAIRLCTLKSLEEEMFDFK